MNIKILEMNQTNITYNTNNTEFIDELRSKVSEYFKSNNLSKYGNFNSVIKAVFMFTLYFAPFILMLTGVISAWYFVLIAWILMGFGKAGVGMGIMHDANHRSLSKHQSVNKFFSLSLYLLGGFPLNWQRQHNMNHHGFTNIDGIDEDINPPSFLRFSPNRPLKKVHKYQYLYAWFFYGLMTILWSTYKDFKQIFRYRRDGVVLSRTTSYNVLITQIIFSKVLYYALFLVLPLIFLPFAWYWVVLFYFAMHFTSGLILATVFQTAHVISTSEFPVPDQTGSIENSFAVHQLLNTSDFAPKNKILSWYVGGLNFQIEHHLFPGVSHVHYSNIAKFVKEMANKYELPYNVQPGFLKAVWEHAKMLKQLGLA